MKTKTKPDKKTTKIMRRRADLDLSHLLRIETAARVADRAAKALSVIADRDTLKQLTEAAEVLKKAASKLELAEKHELLLSGPDGKSGICLDVSTLKDVVDGSEEKKIIGLGSQIRTLGKLVEKYWNNGKSYVLGLSVLVLILVALHMVEVGTALGK